MQANPIQASEPPRLQAVSRETFWKRHVDQWRDSGLSKMAYCQQFSLVYHQMVYWSSKVANADCQISTPEKSFVPVSIAHGDTGSGVYVRLPNGITIEGIDEHSARWIGKLVGQL